MVGPESCAAELELVPGKVVKLWYNVAASAWLQKELRVDAAPGDFLWLVQKISPETLEVFLVAGTRHEWRKLSSGDQSKRRAELREMIEDTPLTVISVVNALAEAVHRGAFGMSIEDAAAKGEEARANGPDPHPEAKSL